ncbi:MULTISPECIES: DUF6684 family protein [unclassified Haladaptatus]|uniref:DUF6684 family protein n=1 Tax=unclassified Haladaptatus TaxID=2622732 RepID=UPI0023E77154|nr:MULTISPECIES: DUF6684 family protein [unclassified Haladaptatus]
MATPLFDRDTWLDLTVNMIPMGIILFFIIGFAIFNPWGFNLEKSSLQYGLLLIPFISMGILTYYAGKAISTGEREIEQNENMENPYETH